MGVQNRLTWESRGRPYGLAQPLRDLRDRLRQHGYTVYDIGNRDHLEHNPPEDHTPFSATGWPMPASYGTGYAIDIMPPARGSGLPSLQQLGARLLADRRAGRREVAWLKYMNWEPDGEYRGACWHESWQPGYVRRPSSDRGHIHLSALTGYERSSVAAGYDPVAWIQGTTRPAAEPAPTRKKAPTVLMLKTATSDTVYVSAGPGQGRAELRSYSNEMAPLERAGVPLVVVADEAGLDRLGGPLLPVKG